MEEKTAFEFAYHRAWLSYLFLFIGVLILMGVMGIVAYEIEKRGDYTDSGILVLFIFGFIMTLLILFGLGKYINNLKFRRNVAHVKFIGNQSLIIETHKIHKKIQLDEISSITLGRNPIQGSPYSKITIRGKSNKHSFFVHRDTSTSGVDNMMEFIAFQNALISRLDNLSNDSMYIKPSFYGTRTAKFIAWILSLSLPTLYVFVLITRPERASSQLLLTTLVGVAFFQYARLQLLDWDNASHLTYCNPKTKKAFN